MIGLAVRNGNTNEPIPVANFRVAGNNANTLFLSSGDPTTCVNGDTLVSGDVVALRFLPTFGSDSIGNYFEDTLLDDYALSNLDYLRLISYVSNTSPITVTLDLTDGSDFPPYANGDFVVVQDVVGTDSANGRFLIANLSPSTNSFDLVGSVGNDDYLYGGKVAKQVGVTIDSQIGNLAYIIAGTGTGTYAKITTNTKSRFYIDGDWPEQPDATSIIVITGPDFAVKQDGIKLSNSTREFVLTQGFDVRNYDKVPVLVQVASISKGGKASLPSLDPIREIFMVGNPLTAPVGVPGSPLFTVRVEEYATLTVNDLVVPENAYLVTEANFLVPSIDDTDITLYGEGIATTASYSANVGSQNSRFGKTLKVGDYVLWNDPQHEYECNFISAITTGALTLVRQDPFAGHGTAFFGSLISAHPLMPSGNEVRLYRLEPKIFTGTIAQNMYGTSATPSGLPQQWSWAWPNKSAAAIMGQIIGTQGNSPLGTINLAPGKTFINTLPNGYQSGGAIPAGSSALPKAPGLRTLSGAAYINLSCSGALAAGSVAAQRIQVQSWSSIRCVTATLLTPSTLAGINVKIHVLWISPDFMQVGLIDTLIIAPNAYVNYGVSDLPQNRQMPYHAGGWLQDTDWPPNELPLLSPNPLVGGVLTLPITPIIFQGLVFAPEGWIDFIVEEPGNASDLTVNVQV